MHGSNPSKDSYAYSDCLKAIDDALAENAKRLTEHLKYNEDEAAEILAGALHNYIDDRYHISDRQSLGF